MAYIVDVQSEQGVPLAGFSVLRDHYLFPDGTQVIIRSDVAWCRDCRNFAMAERLSTAEELEREAEEWFYTKYPEERTPFMQPIMKQVMVGWMKGNVRRYQPLLDYLPHRKSPPRCLLCGGTDFIRFVEWNRWYEHPERDAKFIIVCRGHADTVTHRLYDPEGARLTQ